ncbi:unnamed protein product [Rhizopus stolonifer]
MVIFLFLLGLIATVQAVIEVDPKTIETRATGAFFVEFYQPNNPSCQNFSPQFEKVSDLHQSNSVSFVKINCQDYNHYCQEKGVSTFPTIMSSLHRGAWKRYEPEDSLERFIQENKPYRNTQGISLSIESLEELNEIAQSKEPWFIKFYAPWCGHCKNLAPEWVQVASRLKDKVNVAEVNCDANKALCNAYNIAGLPTLKYFVHGTSIQYHGERKSDSLVEFAIGYSTTAVRGVRRDELLDSLLSKYDVNLIYVTEKEKPDLARLEAIAPAYIESLPFYTTQDPSTAERFELDSLPAIVIIKDEMQYVYDGQQDLADWIHRHSQPLIHTILSHNSNDILRRHPGTVVLGLFSPEDVVSLAAFRQLASEQPGVFFAHLDAWAYAPFVSRAYGVNLVHLPAVVFLQPSQQRYFKWDANRDPLDIARPQQILESLEKIDELEAVSTAPSKAMGLAGKVFDFIQQYWVLFSAGFFVILLILTVFIATSDPGPTKKTDLKKE